MEKFYEKRNCGIPVTIMNIIAYLIGYSLTQNLAATLLIAVLFAAVVFSLQFDDRVKNAIKHSYIIATLFLLIYMIFNLFSSIISIFSNSRLSSFQDGYYKFGFFPLVLGFFGTYGLILVNIVATIAFGLLIFITILNKDVDFAFVKKILGELPHRKTPQKPVNQQPVHPFFQQTDNLQANRPSGQQATNQSVTPPFGQQTPVQPKPEQEASAHQQKEGQPEPPVRQQAVSQTPLSNPEACPNCGKVNISGAKFCGACGTKLI